MHNEQEIKDEMKWVRYERFKKEPRYTKAYLEGYYHALRWVLEKENKLFRP